MKSKIVCIALMAALMLLIALPSAAPAAPYPPSPAKASAPAPGPHPEIEAAISSLQHAKEHLLHASHDFGGHRVDAIKAIDAATHQLEICLKY